nr:hypothetical protein [uncultured Brevibacillus sp.]
MDTVAGKNKKTMPPLASLFLVLRSSVNRVDLLTMRTNRYLACVTRFILYAVTGNLIGKTEEAFCVEIHIILSFPNNGFKIFPYVDCNGKEVVLKTR